MPKEEQQGCCSCHSMANARVKRRTLGHCRGQSRPLGEPAEQPSVDRKTNPVAICRGKWYSSDRSVADVTTNIALLLTEVTRPGRETLMAKMSISVVKGRGSMAHNNRNFTTPNVDKNRIKDNITYKAEPIEQAYEKCFGAEVERYNSIQKRADRKIDNYMDYIRNSKNGEKLFYETVVQVGNKFDCAVGTENGELAKRALQDYMQDFQRRNPNLYVFNAVLHMDEATPHLHIDYIPLAHGYQRGLQVRNSLDKALKEQGIDGKANKKENSTHNWQESEKTALESFMSAYGLERAEERGLKRDHMSIDQYKAVAEQIRNEVRELPKQIETAPTMLNKERVTVKKSDLDALEQRAKLSLVHEKATKQLISEVKNDVQETFLYNEDKRSQALLSQQRAENILAKANDERKKAVELRQNAEKMVKAQEELNVRYNKLYVAYTGQQKTIDTQKDEISALKAENSSLKAQIADLRQSIEERVQKAVEPLKKQIESLKEKIEGMASGQLTLMRAMRYVRDKFSGEVGGAVLNATLRAGNRFFTEDGFEDKAQDRTANLPKSVAKEINLSLQYRKGEEGLGVYTEKGTCLANCESFKQAKELFPKCDIVNRNIDRGYYR